MMPDQSFDPRTWKVAARPLQESVAPAARIEVAAPQPEPRPMPGEPARAGWLGLALSVTILLAGAATAYAMRPASTVLDPGLSVAASSSG